MFRWRHKPPCVRTGVDAPDGSAPQPGPTSRGALKAVVCTDGRSAGAGWGAAVRWCGAHFCPKRCETETHLPSLCPPPLPLWKALRQAPWGRQRRCHTQPRGRLWDQEPPRGRPVWLSLLCPPGKPRNATWVFFYETESAGHRPPGPWCGNDSIGHV